MTAVATPSEIAAPAHGWCCFHCGEHFPATAEGQRAARDHFGPTPDWKPECIDRDEGARVFGLLRRARRAQRFAEDMMRQRDDALASEESMCCVISAWRRSIKGATTPHEVRCAFDSMEGRAMAAEAVLAELQRTAPEAMLAARIAVAGPGTYYPIEAPA